MGHLSTHVLDTSKGIPAKGVTWTIYKIEDRRKRINSGETNIDGRTNDPLLSGNTFEAGVYEIVFEVAKYFEKSGTSLIEEPFLDSIPIRFRIFNGNRNYHVPLLVSPYGYSTYRGS